LHEAGLFNVPGYVVDEEIYFGRQHLAMIRWLLTDKQGHPPI
jgi:2-hydroxychromene-2-carboxylate isomerase